MARVSFIISTFNRRDVLLRTLAELTRNGLAADDYEIHVVDNASSDGTAAAVAEIPGVHLHAERTNRGSCAKNLALPSSTGEFIVFLDDDSYPAPGSIARMIQHFRQQPSLGAATFTVTLPDGTEECSAYPDVFIGCGVGFRREAIMEVGGLPMDFFMQAEEYDLSLRLLDAGWNIERFVDLHVTHLKTPQARSSPRTMRLDVRNNLTLIAKYFPRGYAIPFCVDWLMRYRLIAASKRQRLAFWRGMLEGSGRAISATRQPVSQGTFERFTRINEIGQQMRGAKAMHRLHRILFIDLGKNILPYWLAAEDCDLEVVAIADTRLAGRKYRGVPIITDGRARELDFDAAIVANSSPVHAAARASAWRRAESRPVIDLLDVSEAIIAQAA